MNLTPKFWNMQSEINTEAARTGDTIYYNDACNSLAYIIIEVTDTDLVIQSKVNPKWIDAKAFSQLNMRWTFSETDRRNKELLNIL